MLRVLHVVPNIDPKQGGPAHSVVALVEALKRVDGLEVKLAAAGPADCIDIPLNIRTRWSLLTQAARRRLDEAIGQADVVELHSLWNGTISFAGKTCRRLKVPYLYTPRGMLDPFCLRTRGWLKKLSAALGEEKNIAGAAGFHLLSEEEVQGVLQVRPYLKDRPYAVAPNGLGIVPENYPRGLIAQKFPETVGRKTLLFLGRLDEIKGLELPLQAVAKMRPEARPIVLLVGPDFGQEVSLRQLATSLGIAPWIIFAGPIYGNDRFSLLAEADLVGLTSHYECNSVSGTEAFAVGGAVLATEGSSLRHAAQAGAARVVPRTVEAYSQALQELLNDEQQLQHLRKSARLYALRQLNWDKLVKPLVELYRKIAKNRPH
ncbi:MAG: glycosyltransferase [Gemmatales bacterium]